MVLSVVFIRYSISSYIKIRSKDYEIYTILGMSAKSEKKMMLLEFMCFSLLVMFIGEGIGSILILLIRSISLKYIYSPVNNYLDFSTYLLTALLYVFSVTVSIFSCKIKKSGKKAKRRKAAKEKKKTAGVLALLAGIVFIILSLILVLNFTVGRMILAMILNPAGIFLLIFFFQKSMVPFIKKKEKFYYKHLILCSDLFDHIKSNGWIMFSVYTINFLILYLSGSLFIGLIDDDVPYDDYFKHEVVIESFDNSTLDNMELTGDSFSVKYKMCDMAEPQRYDNVKVIRNSDYNFAMKENLVLKDKEAYAFEQKFAEPFLPYNLGWEVINNHHKSFDIHIVDAGWKYLYTCSDHVGDDFLVVSDDMYDRLSGGEGIIIFMNHISDPDYGPYLTNKERETHIYEKEKLVGKIKLENFYTFLVFFSLSFLLMIDGSFIIYVKFFSEVPEKKQKYELLELIGMRKKEIKTNLKTGYCFIIDVPIYLSAAFGLLLGTADLFYVSSLWIKGMIAYIGFVVCMVLIEKVYVVYLKKKIGKEIM